MSRRLLSGISVLSMLAAAPEVMAQVLADVTIEGPIQTFLAVAPGELAPNGRPIVGAMRVMGATVKVPAGVPIHSPTNESLTWEQFTGTEPAPKPSSFPGRSEPGFLGGTAIVTGDSQGGVIYAADVFSDLNEHVVVGEATGAVTVDDGANLATVNNIHLKPLDDERMPAGAPINGFGFDINPTQITTGSLVSVEGYFAGGRLYYHNFEADGAALINPTTREISILRANCRFRGGNRNELEVRGGTKNPAGGQVTIQYRNPAGSWVSVTPQVLPVVDVTVTPAQGLYRYTSSALTFPGMTVCPAQVRAVFSTGINTAAQVASAGFSPASR